MVVTTSFIGLAATLSHSSADVEGADPDIVMRRAATSKRTMASADDSRELDKIRQLKGRLTVKCG